MIDQRLETRFIEAITNPKKEIERLKTPPKPLPKKDKKPKKA